MLGLSALEDVQLPSPVYPQRPPKTGHCQECCKYIWFHPLTREKIKGFLMFTADSFSDFVWCNIREQRDNSHMKTCAKLGERTVITNPKKKNLKNPHSYHTSVSFYVALLQNWVEKERYIISYFKDQKIFISSRNKRPSSLTEVQGALQLFLNPEYKPVSSSQVQKTILKWKFREAHTLYFSFSGGQCKESFGLVANKRLGFFHNSAT